MQWSACVLRHFDGFHTSDHHCPAKVFTATRYSMCRQILPKFVVGAHTYICIYILYTYMFLIDIWKCTRTYILLHVCVYLGLSPRTINPKSTSRQDVDSRSSNEAYMKPSFYPSYTRRTIWNSHGCVCVCVCVGCIYLYH